MSAHALLQILVAGALLSTGSVASAAAQHSGCRDRWIGRAVLEATGRSARGTGDGGECDLELYGGRWGTYAELRAQADTAFTALRAAGLEYTPDGTALRDLSFGGDAIPLSAVYVGPVDRAPAVSWHIPLARRRVLALERQCPPLTTGPTCIPGRVDPAPSQAPRN